MTARWTSVVIEADGGSRGNPGNAAYGAVLMDAVTGEVIAERGERIGVATNNVAEYRGLIAGLELAAEFAPEADISVRMDSKLVVEQMSGNWKIKHPDMKPLAAQANRLAPFGTTYTWIPREENTYADRLANEALDDVRDADGLIEGATAPSRSGRGRPVASTNAPQVSHGEGVVTTLILLRHGTTGPAGGDRGLTDEGRDQVRAAADWLAPAVADIDLVVTSPRQRASESAALVAERLDKPVEVVAGLAEMGGDESFADVRDRVVAALDALLASYAGKTVVAVSHQTPIAVLVAHTLNAPLESLSRMALRAASVTVLAFSENGHAALRLFNATPAEAGLAGG